MNNETTYPTFTAQWAEVKLKEGRLITEVGFLAPDFVEWGLAHNTHNRHMSNSLVRSYANMMKQGKWPFTNNGIGFTRSGFLSDGQHRLAALRESGYPKILMAVSFGLDDVAQLVTDRQKVRNCAAGVALTTGLVLTSQQAGVITWLHTLDTGMDYVYTNRVDEFAFADLVKKYYQPICDVFEGKKRRGLTAAFFGPLVYLRANGENLNTIRSFVDGVETGEGLEKGDPRLKYRNHFLTGRSQAYRADRIMAFIESAQMFLAYANGQPVYAFQAWQQNKVFNALRDRAKWLREQSSLIKTQETAQ